MVVSLLVLVQALNEDTECKTRHTDCEGLNLFHFCQFPCELVLNEIRITMRASKDIRPKPDSNSLGNLKNSKTAPIAGSAAKAEPARRCSASRAPGFVVNGTFFGRKRAISKVELEPCRPGRACVSLAALDVLDESFVPQRTVGRLSGARARRTIMNAQRPQRQGSRK